MRSSITTTAALMLVASTLVGASANAQVGDLRALRVVDVDGKTVGRWENGSVVMVERGKTVRLLLDGVGANDPRLIWASMGQALCYESTDCSGKGWVNSSVYGMAPGYWPSVLMVSVSGAGQLYVADDIVAKAAPARYHSYLNESVCTTADLHPRVAPSWAFSQPPVDLDAEFTLPLIVK